MSIFHGAAAKILRLKRRCPKCGSDQVVPESRERETVKCRFCGAEIPPKKT
ncbi:MAG: 30S ribosomal protein S27 [Deltaproteobacteria bacterium HGW-Deltaproteobacteria-19]|nr:MAG: 30S ribosomal protein S27 [Deltaproteobacteria bacterium HGW-Deltaproteobacteria-19]